MKKILLFLSLLSILIAEQKSFDVNSFGSFGVSYNNNKELIYRSDLIASEGSSDNHLSLDPLTNFGLQINYNFNDSLSANVQALYKNRYQRDITLEWANIKYNITDTQNLRFGIMRIPLFMFSDVSNVSYTYDATHLSNEVYTSIITNYEGMEYSKTFFVNDFDIHLSLTAGLSNNSQNDVIFEKDTTLDITLNDFLGLYLNTQYEDFLLRASYFKAKIKVDNHQLMELEDGINLLINPLNQDLAASIINDLTIDAQDTRFYGLGFRYSRDFVMASEYTKIDIADNGLLQELTGWYFQLGYRFNKFTPFVSIAKRDQKQLDTNQIEGSLTQELNSQEQLLTSQINQLAQSDPTSLNPAVQAQIVRLGTILGTLQQGIPLLNENIKKSVETSNISQKSASLGLRYDYSNNISFKVQYEYIDVSAQYPSIHLNNDPLNPSMHNMNILNLSVNFVY